MNQKSDPALDKMTELVRSLVEIMRQGNLPAVDFQDERAVLLDGGLGAVGFGQASGNKRVQIATVRAIADMMERRKAAD